MSLFFLFVYKNKNMYTTAKLKSWGDGDGVAFMLRIFQKVKIRCGGWKYRDVTVFDGPKFCIYTEARSCGGEYYI